MKTVFTIITACLIGAVVAASLAQAQNVAIRTYKAGNEKAFPVGWVAEERPIGSSTSTPIGFDQVMTREQLQAYRSDYASAIATWQAQQLAAEQVAVTAARTNTIDWITRLGQAERNWDTLTAGQKDQATRIAIRALLRLLEERQ